VRDSKPCELCGVEIPFKQSIVAHAIERSTGKVLWVCSECRQQPDMIPADQCDLCQEWKPREGGQAAEAENARGESVEGFWACEGCMPA
jgi:ribosome-binding protein aMBF1 (putative translation factor)